MLKEIALIGLNISKNTFHAKSDVVTDDTIRFYLARIGEYPLLSRVDELAIARRIEEARDSFRRSVLESDFALRAAVALLRRAQRGDVRLDRFISVSTGTRDSRERIAALFQTHLPTIEALLARNAEEYRVVCDTRRSKRYRELIWKTLKQRRRRVVRLVEEFGLRVISHQHFYDQWRQLAKNIADCEREVADGHVASASTRESIPRLLSKRNTLGIALQANSNV